MHVIVAILVPILVFIGGPVALHHYGIIYVQDWFTFLAIVTAANTILAFKILLTDYAVTCPFSLLVHSIQLGMMAISAFVVTMAIQFWNSQSVLQGIPTYFYPYKLFSSLLYGLEMTRDQVLCLLVSGSFIAFITTVITAVIVQRINEEKWRYTIPNTALCYFCGLFGYYLYLFLFLSKVVR